MKELLIPEQISPSRFCPTHGDKMIYRKTETKFDIYTGEPEFTVYFRCPRYWPWPIGGCYGWMFDDIEVKKNERGNYVATNLGIGGLIPWV